MAKQQRDKQNVDVLFLLYGYAFQVDSRVSFNFFTVLPWITQARRHNFTANSHWNKHTNNLHMYKEFEQQKYLLETEDSTQWSGIT